MYLAVACFVSLPQQHILLLALDLLFFPYTAIFPEWAFLLYFYFFPGSLYFSARYLRLFGGRYNLQLMSGGAFFFLDVREARKGLL